MPPSKTIISFKHAKGFEISGGNFGTVDGDFITYSSASGSLSRIHEDHPLQSESDTHQTRESNGSSANTHRQRATSARRPTQPSTSYSRDRNPTFSTHDNPGVARTDSGDFHSSTAGHRARNAAYGHNSNVVSSPPLPPRSTPSRLPADVLSPLVTVYAQLDRLEDITHHQWPDVGMTVSFGTSQMSNASGHQLPQNFMHNVSTNITPMIFSPEVFESGTTSTFSDVSHNHPPGSSLDSRLGYYYRTQGSSPGSPSGQYSRQHRTHGSGIGSLSDHYSLQNRMHGSSLGSPPDHYSWYYRRRNPYFITYQGQSAYTINSAYGALTVPNPHAHAHVEPCEPVIPRSEPVYTPPSGIPRETRGLLEQYPSPRGRSLPLSPIPRGTASPSHTPYYRSAVTSLPPYTYHAHIHHVSHPTSSEIQSRQSPYRENNTNGEPHFIHSRVLPRSTPMVLQDFEGDDPTTPFVRPRSQDTLPEGNALGLTSSPIPHITVYHSPHPAPAACSPKSTGS